ncbi:type ISP restriction/modification enzyme [Dietzia cinnamea]|uniref:type ISP restriction/modification enzyme n=6 Tax=Dietzia cinnamea TaxID=321318 RepID=UPI0021AED0C0|nr:type ISP restriction/modification enzyme [Dietzia cinnamea]MCT2035089.1 N-6 DNA methylase [Dietzia cinnamea]
MQPIKNGRDVRVEPKVIEALAQEYAVAVQSAASMGVAAEPEAQLTNPVDNFLTRFAAEAGLGELTLIREAQLDGVRPDFAAAIDKRPCGWIELKAPGHTLDGNRWRGREKKQWALLEQLDSLVVTDGQAACLYFEGKPVTECDLPFEADSQWSPDALRHLLEMFFSAQVAPIKRVSQLAHRLAPLARFIRVKLADGLENNRAAVMTAKAAWEQAMPLNVSAEHFPSDVAQVIAYSMAIAGLSGNIDANGDGTVTLKEAKEALELAHRNVLAAALGPIIGIPQLTEYIAPEVGAIMRLVSSMDVEAIQASSDRRGEPWLWFYEDFLAQYDPKAREEAGVYYTPTSVVQYQVRTIDHLLRTRFGQPLGFGAKNVVTLDPAAGSGTYPLAVIDQAVETATAERGPAGAQQIVKNLTQNLLAFELLPGPYAVAHLRIGQRLADAAGHLVQVNEIGVYLTDTLEDPTTPKAKGLWGDAKVLSDAGERARKIKADQKITVALGNPPYDRVTSDSGGWVMHADAENAALFDDVIKPAQDRGVIFSAQASLYNLYVYFWRWAIWKVLEQHQQERAIVSFITASSWITGPAFVGLRQLAVDVASDVWVLDLGGEGRGARKEDNVFAIQSPVAIVTLVRKGKATKPAEVYYRRIRGTRQDKLDQLDTITRLSPDDGWVKLAADHGEPFVPGDTDPVWTGYAALADLFPWQQPGIKYNRAWPVAPSPDVLKRRWAELLSDPDEDLRAERYVTGDSGRNIYTRVGTLPPIAELPAGFQHQPIVRLGWRSFDQQWTFDDPRVINLERPSLWQALSDSQIFLISPGTETIGSGPAATVSSTVPDLHYFCNRGGKDVIPLYRDREARKPNVTAGLLDQISERLSVPVSPEDLMAYCFALIAHSGYSSMFWDQLEYSNVRVPITAEAGLFSEAVELGRELLWLQTYAQRFHNDQRPRGRVPRRAEIVWSAAVTSIPADTKAIRYDADTRKLHIGDGTVEGVRPDVWGFEVSGMNVLDKWIGARTRKGIGRAATNSATPLDKIRPTSWADEWNDELLDLIRVLTASLDLAPKQHELLQRIVDGPTIDASCLPRPTEAERTVPETLSRDARAEANATEELPFSFR